MCAEKYCIKYTLYIQIYEQNLSHNDRNTGATRGHMSPIAISPWASYYHYDGIQHKLVAEVRTSNHKCWKVVARPGFAFTCTNLLRQFSTSATSLFLTFQRFFMSCISTSIGITRAVQPVATCRQSPYLHEPAVIIMTSFSLWRHSPLSWPRRRYLKLSLSQRSWK